MSTTTLRVKKAPGFRVDASPLLPELLDGKPLAEIERIEPYGDTGKYKLFFKGAPTVLPNAVPYGDAPSGVMQAPRYTTREKLLAAKSVMDINLS